MSAMQGVSHCWIGEFFFIYMKKRFINIGISESIEAVGTKDRLEAFAFALLVKLTFVDSRIKSTSIRQMTFIFRMGWTKLKRVLNNAQKYGYIVREGDSYFVPTLKQCGSFNYKARFVFCPLSHTEDGRTAYKLCNLMDEIRKVVLKNHIKKQESFYDTALGVNAPGDDKEYRTKRKRLKRMCGITSVSDEMLKKSRRLSIRRSMTVMGTKRSTTRRLIKEMIEAKEITREFENIPTGIDPKQIEGDYFMQQAIYKANRLGGYIHIFRGAVYIQVANRYSLSERESKLITYRPKMK